MSEAANNIKSEFESLIKHGQNVRSTKKNGLESWQPYKQHYQSQPGQFVMKPEYRKIFENYITYLHNAIDSEIAVLVAGKKLTNGIETEHFFVQLFRIAYMENFTLSTVKLMQIAYNIGQLKAVLQNEDVYDRTTIEFLESIKFDDISTYIDM